MKINLIILFRCLISGSKRKYKEPEIHGIDSTAFYTRESISSKFVGNPCDRLVPSDSSQFDDLFTNLGNDLDARYDSDELLKFLGDDGNNLEKANDETKNDISGNFIAKNIMNVHEEEECFTMEQFDKYIAKKFDDFHDDHLKPVNEEIISNKEHMKNGDGRLSFVNLISSRRYTLKSYIENFVLSKIPESYTNNYEKNVKTIDEACKVFDKYNVQNNKHVFTFEHEHFRDLLNNLKDIILSFDKSVMFNNETYDRFSFEYYSKIYSPKYSRDLRFELANLSHDNKIIFFYGELMKLYKYVPDIPEILTLGGLFDDRFFPKIVFIMHMINLLAEEVENIKTYRVFILFMIIRAFRSSSSGSFNPFGPARHEIICDEGYHDLYFFIWKFNAQRRRDIKRRKLNPFRSESGDFVHLKTILLNYLYQHSIFFKYYNICEERVLEFQKFIDKVIENKECIGCLFNEYLSKIKID